MAKLKFENLIAIKLSLIQIIFDMENKFYLYYILFEINQFY